MENLMAEGLIVFPMVHSMRVNLWKGLKQEKVNILLKMGQYILETFYKEIFMDKGVLNIKMAVSI